MMTEEALYARLREALRDAIARHHLDERSISLKSRGLTPEEAIGRTARTLMHALVLCCLVTALNALFNHSGATELAVLFGNPLTMEALVYGLVSSLMLLTMWLWCAVWRGVATGCSMGAGSLSLLCRV